MTVEELKAELCAIMERVDDTLAEELMRDKKASADFGQWLQVTQLFPRALQGQPESGQRGRLAVSVDFVITPVAYNYVASDK